MVAQKNVRISLGPSLRIRFTLQFKHIKNTIAGTMLFTKAVLVAVTLSVIVHAPQVNRIMVTT